MNSVGTLGEYSGQKNEYFSIFPQFSKFRSSQNLLEMARHLGKEMLIVLFPSLIITQGSHLFSIELVGNLYTLSQGATMECQCN